MKAWSLMAVFLLLLSCGTEEKEEQKPISEAEVSSPNKQVNLKFFLLPDGVPAYTVSFNGKTAIDTSSLGFDLKGGSLLGKDMTILKATNRDFQETWEMPWGEQQLVENKFSELKLFLQEESGEKRLLNVTYRVYDDGLGFRYEFPKQENLKEAVILDENTEFNFTGDHRCWWIPGDWDIYEHLYTESKLSEIDANAERFNNGLAQTHIPENAVNTPVTLKTEEGIYISLHEANLTNYSGMTLKVDPKDSKLTSELVGGPNDHKVVRTLPFETPWRTIQLANRAGDLIESNLIVNLNEPNQLGDISWFEPTKYLGIWWEMHLNKSSWDVASGRHGATTAHAKELIDFAADHNIGALLVEGWNTGWEHWIGFEDREGVFDFVTPYPDYDLEEVVRYGNEKGVKLIMHHETSAAPRTYEQQLDTAYALMQRLGIHAVKTGYVGKIIPKGEFHHGQWMVNHYRKVLETAARHQIAINAHEPIKATGLRRTFPNAIAREGLRGQEFNAWSGDGGNPPDHLPTVAFTRMLAGPIDFTPGIFHLSLDPYRENNQINTTLAHQLALYVVIYSPVQMAADLIENYEGHPAFNFIEDVGVNWEESRVLNGEIGDFVTIARKERGTGNWFLGSITDENSRELEVSLDFLEPGQKYIATIYKDGATAHWQNNPQEYEITSEVVEQGQKLQLALAAGGGTAISFHKAPSSGTE